MGVGGAEEGRVRKAVIEARGGGGGRDDIAVMCQRRESRKFSFPRRLSPLSPNRTPILQTRTHTPPVVVQIEGERTKETTFFDEPT